MFTLHTAIESLNPHHFTPHYTQFEACQQHDQTRARNLRSRVVVLERELRLDEAEWRSQTESIAGLLLDALRHFRHAIALEGEEEEEEEERGGSRGGAGLGDDGDEDEEDGEQGGGGAGPVFRLVALWFEPRNAADARVNQEMAAFAAEVSTHKVVPLIYQVKWGWFVSGRGGGGWIDRQIDSFTCTCTCDPIIVYIHPFVEQILSRLGSGTQEFARAVEALVYRACKEHPFHTLLQVGCCS